MFHLVLARYGVHFHVDVMTAEELQLMHTCDKDLAKAIHLPAPNKYIPYALKNEDIGRDRDTLPAESIHQLNVPDVLQTTNRGNLLFTADKIFGHPRSALFLLVGRGNVTEGADGSVTTTPYTVKQNQLNRLTTKFYSRQHAVDRYPADVAGLYHGVTWWKRFVVGTLMISLVLLVMNATFDVSGEFKLIVVDSPLTWGICY